MAAVASGSSASAVAAGSVRRVSRPGPGFSASLPSMPVSVLRSSRSMGASCIWCLLVVRCASTGDVGVSGRLPGRPIGSGAGGGDVAGLLLAGFQGLGLRHRDLVGAGGRFGLEAALIAVVDVAADDMEDSGYRDGEQGA